MLRCSDCGELLSGFVCPICDGQRDTIPAPAPADPFCCPKHREPLGPQGSCVSCVLDHDAEYQSRCDAARGLWIDALEVEAVRIPNDLRPTRAPSRRRHA